MKKISICTGTYNEEKNISVFCERCVATLSHFPQYDYEIIVADNCSKDNTRSLIREIASRNRKVKCIFNSNNFGGITSGINAFLSASGDAVVLMCSDLQDPPEIIAEFIQKWEEGYKVVCAVKEKSFENPLMYLVRKFYYWLLKTSAEGELISNFTGFGLYDRCFVDALRKYHDPYPYFRGLVTEIGFKRCLVPYTQEKRKHGKSSYNFLRYYDYAMTGFVNHTKLPLRLATFVGFLTAGASLLIAIAYFAYKVIFWDSFQLGLAPMVIGLFFFSAVQLMFIGILGEYVGAIWVQVKNKPLVIEEERINFNDVPKESATKESDQDSEPGNREA